MLRVPAPLVPAAVLVLSAVGAAWAQEPATATPPRPAREATYTITSRLQLVPPFRLADMQDDFQEARLVAREGDTATFEITYYPLHEPEVGENSQWRTDYAGMTEYLKPAPAANWDGAMQRDLLKELRAAGIEPDRLTDRELVRQVSRWAMRRARATKAFAIWCVDFPGGRASVVPELRDAFERQKPDRTWTDQQMFDEEVLGRGMFYNKVHGSCTSAAVYLATIFRALGIPARLVVCIPPFDPNDDQQARLFYDRIHHHEVRETVRAALDGMTGFDNHIFNEVYVGHRWVRLNYSTLGQPILDSRYFGLLTHLFTCSDLSEVPLPATWGARYFKYPADQSQLSSVNPYRLISVADHFGANATIANPEVPPAELRTATIIGLYRQGDKAVPAWVGDSPWQQGRVDFLIAYREWIRGGYLQMRAFEKRVSHDFVLTAPACPEIAVQLSGLKLSTGDGSFQAFGARIAPADRAKIQRSVDYTLRPRNKSDVYRWATSPDLPALRWAASDR
ncbi:MAG: transglutaminase domain-containing protein [Verrucomicrobia bacterium]|nr:transglutaminase domain-containing protein [Verrucomicrobiota bacterium]